MLIWTWLTLGYISALFSLLVISSYPYPPEFLGWMRSVFDDPMPFINACLQAYVSHTLSHTRKHSHKPEIPFQRAVRENFTGFNVDWEPTADNDPPTAEDARKYAQFLSTFADALHSIGKVLTVKLHSLFLSIAVLHQLSGMMSQIK